MEVYGKMEKKIFQIKFEFEVSIRSFEILINPFYLCKPRSENEVKKDMFCCNFIKENFNKDK